MRQIIGRRKIWFSLSGIMVGLSILFLVIWGLNLGIDFTGGSLLEIRFSDSAPTNIEIKDQIKNLGIPGEISVQATENQGFLIRTQSFDEQTHQQLLGHLTAAYVNDAGETRVSQERFESIGPSIGQELRSKAVYSIIVVLICIVIYIAWAFRKVSFPMKSWKFGVIAIIALFHDILITLGIFSLLGHFWDVEVGLPFVAALLTILGYSVNDTIVVFDRIRENLSRLVKTDFTNVVNRSVNETITRSINTSLTTLIVLGAIFLFGGSSIKFFILALICGIGVGTYSSIFVASPLLVAWERFKKVK